MSRTEECQRSLVILAQNQGYLTFDNIIEAADDYNLRIAEVDSLSEALQIRGIIVYEEDPRSTANDELEDYSRVDYESIFSEVIEMDENLKPLIEDIKECPPPQYGEINTLFAQIRDGNAYARERLANLYLRTAVKIALSMTKQYNFVISDAISAGFVGLMVAIDKYDPNGFSVFHSYVSLWVQQCIQRYCNPSWLELYFPAHYKEKMFKVYQRYISATGDSELEREIDFGVLSAISLEMDVTLEEAERCLKRVSEQINGMVRLDAIEETEIEKDLFPYISTSEDSVYEIAEKKDLKRTIDDVLESLTSREAKVLRMRYGLSGGTPMTLEEVGQKFGVTRERIRQIESKAFRKLVHPSRVKKLKEFYY